jgi:hypothetical protein
MTRQILVAVGAALLTIGGSGIMVALVWLTANKINGTLPYIYDTRAEALLFLLPAILLTVAIVGAVFVSTALSASPRNERNAHNLHPHTHFHA